jgi:hypothetical protein
LTELVTAGDHRDALRDDERQQEIALLPPAKRDDGRIIGRAFGAAVPGQIVESAVAILLAVCLVVFPGSSRDVGQRVAVV